MSQPFDYPTSKHCRRHGPSGYADYESYREWLRDEFCFRCVYCMTREVWALRAGRWHIDHFIPMVNDPTGALDYDNLVYACASCNVVKGRRPLPDPARVAYGTCVKVDDDGRISPLNDDGKRLILTLCLDDDDHTDWRRRFLGVIRCIAAHEPQLYREYMGFPEDLPDLSLAARRSAKILKNSRPAGISQSYFSQRKSGTLPLEY